MTIKELFEKSENGTLTFDQFNQFAESAKFVDLSEGNYVSKNKYTEDLQSKDTEIEGLKTTISTRDTDLKELRKQLKAAGTDADKLAQLSGDLETLQGKYTTDTQALQQKLDQQAYEFAVREFAGTKKFTSNAAKRDFISSMIAEGLKLDKDTSSIVGAEDFANKYNANNSDAFIVETPSAEPTPTQPKPQFVASTQGNNTPNETNAFLQAFNFSGVRPMPKAE